MEESEEHAPSGTLPSAPEVATGSHDANLDPLADDDTLDDVTTPSTASEPSSVPQQQPNCDATEVPDAAALLFAGATTAPDLRRSSSSSGVAASRGVGFSLSTGLGRRSRSRSGGDDGDHGSSELVQQLQRLCRRQRQRSEERAFVRDVERVLTLLRAQTPASSGAGVTSATFPGPGLSLETLGSVQEEDEAAGEERRSSVTKTLTLAEIDALLDCIADLFDHRNPSVRALAFEVVQLCLLRFGERLTPALRRKIYLRLETHAPGDFLLRQKALRALTQDGRHLEPFHVELGWFLLRLLEQSDAQRDLLGLIQSILRRNPGHWIVTRFVAFYHVLAAHDLAYAASTPACLRSLCCIVNADGHGTWSVMKLLLDGSSGFLVLRGLLQLLEHPTGVNSPWVLRGAVFFVGMSCWGSQRVAKFDDIAWAPILLALEQALQCCRGVVIFEVILSVQRLIKKFGAAHQAGSGQCATSSLVTPSKLSSQSGDRSHDTTTSSGATTSIPSSNRDKRCLVMEWDIILRMLQTLRPWVSMTDENEIEEAPQRTMQPDNRRSEAKVHRTAAIHPENDLPDQPQHHLSISIQQTRIPRELLDTLQAVEDLVEQHQFGGDVDEFLNILEDYLPHLSENSMLFLLRQRAEAAHPGYHLDWLSTLSAAMRIFFTCTSPDGDALPVPRTVRLEALEVLRVNLWTSRNVCEDRVIEEVVIPTLGRIYEDPDAEVRRRGLWFIIEVARQLESVKFDSLLDILASAMTLSSNEDAQLVAVSGIVSLFSSAFDHLPPARAVRMYDLLATTVETHRSRNVRHTALSCMLNVCEARASDGKLQWKEQQQIRTSRFLFVSRRAARINAAGVQLTASCVPVARALRALLTLVSAEPDAELFRMAVKGIKTMLENRAILEDVDVSEVSAKVVASIDYRAFGRAAIPDEVDKLLHDQKDDLNSSEEDSTILIPRHHKSQDDGRRAGRAIPLTDAKLVRSIRSMSAGGSDNTAVSFCASVQATAALLAKTRFLTMGIELLQLLVSYEAELHDNAVQELTRCLIGAMKVRLAVAEKDLFAGGASGDDSTLSGSASSPNILYHHEETEAQVAYASGTPLGFTSRVLSRFQTSASHGNLFHALSGSVSKSSLGPAAPARASTPERPTRKDRARLQEFLRQLFEAEFTLLHTTTIALSLVALLASGSVLGQLDEVLQSLRACVTTVDGDFRPDAFVAVLELLGVIVPILTGEPEESVLRAHKAIIEALLLGFEYAKSRQLSYLAFRLLCQVIQQSDRKNRIQLAALAMPTLQQCTRRANSLLAEAAVDFLMCYAYSQSALAPSALVSRRQQQNEEDEMSSMVKVLGLQEVIIDNHDYVKGDASLVIRRANCTSRWELGACHDLSLNPAASSLLFPRSHLDGASSAAEKSEPLRIEGHSRQAEGDDGHEGSPGNPVIRAIREDVEENNGDIEALHGLVENEDEESENEMGEFLLNDSIDEPLSIPVQAPRVLHFSSNNDSTSAGMHGLSALSNEDQYDPTYLMMQLFDITLENRPNLLSDGPSLRLALSVLDRTPEYETHKIGLLYVRDEKQSSESAILGNTGGSPRYLRFLRGLGTFTKLEGLPGYSGGLDTTGNSDGQFGLIYKDACTQIMFHVATMMVPDSNRSVDSTVDNFSSMKKKRHIGNDFVHVVFKFNDVHIVIQPLNDREYRTEVHVKAGIPPFGPLYGKQIVSSSIISEIVRLTCLNANLACQVFHQDLVGFALNCEERLKQIKQLGLRLATADEWKLD
ncbi:Tuberin, N-terminal [Phytophthora cactorum]|nr:Tuberin, N-terminal [Phytophthora cactorum]